jgi:flagellar basal body-associated protein FliL
MIRILLFGLIGLLLVAIAAMAGWVFALHRPLPFTLPAPVAAIVEKYVPQAIAGAEEANQKAREALPPPVDPLTLAPADPGYYEISPAFDLTILDPEARPKYLVSIAITLVLRSPEQEAMIDPLKLKIRDALLTELLGAVNRPNAMDSTGRVDTDYLSRRAKKAAVGLLGPAYVWDALVTTATQRPADSQLR